MQRAPKFTYSGNSREEVLSHLLRDIANPPKLECTVCGRQSVDPVDMYCARCGSDAETDEQRDARWTREMLADAMKLINRLHEDIGINLDSEWLEKINSHLAGQKGEVSS